MATFVGATFIVALPLGLYFLQHPADFTGRMSQLSVFSTASPFARLFLNTLKTLAMFNFRGDENWRHNSGGNPELFRPVGIMFLIGIATTIIKIWSDFKTHKPILRSEHQEGAYQNFSLLLVISVFILGILPVVFSTESIPHALRSILMIPPAVLFAALGGIGTYNWLKKYVRPSRLNAVMVVFCAFLGRSAIQEVFHRLGTKSERASCL